jgi:hypothetical protein
MLKQALGGDMAWKKALFLGGAVLLLAACSDATAPNSLRTRDGGPSTAAWIVPSMTPFKVEFELPDDGCSDRSGYYVRSGDKDLCIDLPEFP